MSARGFAVRNETGEILVGSVCATEIGAIVNWLVLDQHVLASFLANDAHIRHVWERHRGKAQVVPVTITEAQQS